MTDDYATNSHYLTYAFLSKRLGECTFWVWEWKGWSSCESHAWVTYWWLRETNCPPKTQSYWRLWPQGAEEFNRSLPLVSGVSRWHCELAEEFAIWWLTWWVPHNNNKISYARESWSVFHIIFILYDLTARRYVLARRRCDVVVLRYPSSSRASFM